MALYHSGGIGDNVVGSNGIVGLSRAFASLYGSSDTMTFLRGVNSASVNDDDCQRRCHGRGSGEHHRCGGRAGGMLV